MRPLTLDDLLPLDDYAGRRREFFASLAGYLDRYRRVRLGPRVTLLFENRQTLWFRVQEILRIARLTEPMLVQRELDLYNRLLPGRQQLQAALLIEISDEKHLTEELRPWEGLQGEHLSLVAGEERYAASLVTCRPEDRSLGAAHWVRFTLDEPGRQLLADLKQPAFFALECPFYQHVGPGLSDDTRQSLLEDLELSDRDDLS